MTASYTSTYWQPGPEYFPMKSFYPIANNLGFLFDIPRENPIAGPHYYGEGSVPGDRRLIMRSDPEYYAVDGYIPTINGKPMIDMNDKAYAFDRSKYTFTV